MAPMDLNLAPFPPLLTLPSVQRDFTEWRQGREHYGVWAIDVDLPPLRAATSGICTHLDPYLLPGYQRQPHITVHLCGFPSSSPRLDDDYPRATLAGHLRALADARLAPFPITIGAAATFESAPYFSVQDLGGGIARMRQALATTGHPQDSFSYTPHVTFGLYRDHFPLAEVQRRIRTGPDLELLPLTVKRLSLMVYEAAVIGGPLSSLCHFDLEQQAVLWEKPMNAFWGMTAP